MKSRFEEMRRKSLAQPCATRPVYDWRKVSAERDVVVKALRRLADRLARARTVAEIHRIMDEQLDAPTPQRAA